MGKKRSREALAPDITPLIDIVFLLLIFFMVSTVFKKDELALMLSLPDAQSGNTIDAKRKSLSIEISEGKIAFQGKAISFEALNRELVKITNKTTPVEVRIDKQVRYERIIKIFDTLKAKKLNNLELITK